MIMMSGNYGTYGRIELGLDRIYGCNEDKRPSVKLRDLICIFS